MGSRGTCGSVEAKTEAMTDGAECWFVGRSIGKSDGPAGGAQ